MNLSHCLRLAMAALVTFLAGWGFGCAGGTGAHSDPVPAVAAPTNLRAWPDNGRAHLEWEAVAGADSYLIYRGTHPGFGASAGNLITTSEETSSSVTGLVNGTEVWFTVTAINSRGESAPSNEASTIPGSVVIPPPPALLHATPGNQQAQLVWLPAPGATSYNVYISSSPGISQSSSIPLGSLILPYGTVTNMTNGIQQWFAVSAVNGAGESPLSPEVSVIPSSQSGGGQSPPAPSGLTATVTGTSVTFHWTGSATAHVYFIHFGLSPGVIPGPSNVVAGASGTQASLGGLQPGYTYYFVVTASNGYGISPSSNVVAVHASTAGGVGSPNHGLFTGTWSTAYFNTEITIGYLANIHAVLVWYEKEGSDFFGNPCSTQVSLSPPFPIQPDNSFNMVFQTPGNPDDLVRIQGHFTDQAHVIGFLEDINDNFPTGCNPPGSGNFSAVWHP